MKLNTVAYTLTRPNNTNAYALGDVIASSTTAGDVVPVTLAGLANTKAGTGYITKARLWVDGAAFATPLRLHLFVDTPPQIADNAPFELDFAISDNHIGIIDFPVAFTGATGSDAVLFELNDLRLAIRSKNIDGGNPIYGVITARGAFTPTANQRFKVQLTCDAYEY
jgi:hypothetical protein